MTATASGHISRPAPHGNGRRCIFVSDLHGSSRRYKTLFDLVGNERPSAVLLGGDLFPGFSGSIPADGGGAGDFIGDVLFAGFGALRETLGERYPRVFLILGNDDPRSEEPRMEEGAAMRLWEYLPCRSAALDEFRVFGYPYVPPTPFGLKDWERYDVSRYVDPGCTHPWEGWRSVPADEREARYATIAEDLEKLTEGHDVARGIFLIHTPPHQTSLDRAGLDGQMVDHVPLDVHVGSIAVKRFIERRRPYLTLHGHIHEAARITGRWRERIGETPAFTAAHEGPELAVVRFDLEDPESATRELV